MYEGGGPSYQHAHLVSSSSSMRGVASLSSRARSWAASFLATVSCFCSSVLPSCSSSKASWAWFNSDSMAFSFTRMSALDWWVEGGEEGMGRGVGGGEGVGRGVGEVGEWVEGWGEGREWVEGWGEGREWVEGWGGRVMVKYIGVMVIRRRGVVQGEGCGVGVGGG